MADENVGKVSLELGFDSRNFDKEVDESAKKAETKMSEAFDKAGANAEKSMDDAAKKISAILADSEKSMKSKASSIAWIYRKQGMSASDAMKKAWEQIERQSGKSTSKVEKNITGIEKQSGKSSNKIKKDITGIEKHGVKSSGRIGSAFSSAASKAENSFSSAFKKIGAVIAGAFAVRQVIRFGQECLELGSDLAEVQNVVDVTFPALSKQIDIFAQNAAESFGLSETMAKKFAGTFGAMSKAFGFTEKAALDMSATLTGLAGDVASFYNISQDETYTKLKSVFTGETETLKDLGVVMTQNALDAYALANGYGKVTAKMSEQEKVALRYQFVLDKLALAQGDFARTSDGWANQTRILKLQFDSLKASIGQGLINVLSPVVKWINTILAGLNKLAKAFASFTAAIMGKKSGGGGGSVSGELAAATANADNLSSSVGGVGGAAKKAAKEIQKSFAGLDEITTLAKPTSDAGGSGGGSGAGGGSFDGAFGDVDFSSMFDETQIESSTSFWVEQIKRAIERGDWAGVGAILGSKFNEIINSVDFKRVGEILGKGIQTAFEFLYSFLDNINFDKIGVAIADFFNGAFEQIDFKLIGKTFAKKWTILTDLLYGFVTTFDWSKFGLAVSDIINGFFEEVNLSKIAYSLQVLALGLLTSLQKAIQNVQWYKIGTDISNALNEINWVALFGSLAKTLSDALIGLLDIVCGAVEALDWGKLGEDLWNSIVAAITNIDWGSLQSKFWELLGGIMGGSYALTAGLWQSVWESLENACNDTISYFEEFIKGAGGDIIQGLLNGIIDALKNVGEWIKEHIFKPFIDGFKNAFGIHSPSKEMEPLGGFIISGLWEGLKKSWHNITDFFKEKLDGIKAKFSQAWENIKTTASEKFGKIKTTISGVMDGIKGGISRAWETIKSTFSNTLESIKGTVSRVFNGIWNTIRGIINSILGGIEKMANGVINGFNGMIRALNNLSFDVPSWVPGLGGGKFGFNIPVLSNVSIPKLAQGGYVKANTPQLAMIGDNRHEGEIVAPESKIAEAVANGLKSTDNNGPSHLILAEMIALLKEQNRLLRELVDKDNDVIVTASSIAKGAKRKNLRDGKTIIPVGT